MKYILAILSFFLSPLLLVAQQFDTGVVKMDSTGIVRDSLPPGKDSLQQLRIDSSAAIKKAADSITSQRNTFIDNTRELLDDNLYLNWKGTPVAMVNTPVNKVQEDRLFYLLLFIIAMFGLFRFFYTRYFNNLFRVFFNASLRQSQLTDQLLQAKLPSLFYNMIFILIGGIYIYLLLRYYNWVSPQNFWLIVFYCGFSLGFIYFIKLLSLKFTGWLTGYKEITNTYIFIIFLINKVLATFLLPFVIIMAFSSPALITTAVVISLLLTSLMFLLRFFRSYGLLQHKLKISRLHFFMYVIGLEVLPLLLIYKGLVLLLSKNL